MNLHQAKIILYWKMHLKDFLFIFLDNEFFIQAAYFSLFVASGDGDMHQIFHLASFCPEIVVEIWP